MKDFLSVPKLMNWQHSLSQQYVCSKSQLVVSGCSFTANTVQLQTAASWPGYVMDRCRFDQCTDYSYPGVGNKFIHDSIIYHLGHLTQEQAAQCMVIVMWSGLNRKEKIVIDQDKKIQNSARLGKMVYIKESIDYDNFANKRIAAEESAELMFDLQRVLEARNIPYVFSLYCNMLFAPYIHKRDNTFEFDKFVSNQTLLKLQELPWVPTQPMDFLYEFAFRNDCLDPVDLFHPRGECNLRWTDEILLPGICQQGLIQKL